MDKFLQRTLAAYTSVALLTFFFFAFMMFSAAAELAKGHIFGGIVFFFISALNFFAVIDNWKMRGVTKKMIEELKK